MQLKIIAFIKIKMMNICHICWGITRSHSMFPCGGIHVRGASSPLLRWGQVTSEFGTRSRRSELSLFCSLWVGRWGRAACRRHALPGLQYWSSQGPGSTGDASVCAHPVPGGVCLTTRDRHHQIDTMEGKGVASKSHRPGSLPVLTFWSPLDSVQAWKRGYNELTPSNHNNLKQNMVTLKNNLKYTEYKVLYNI